MSGIGVVLFAGRDGERLNQGSGYRAAGLPA